MTRRGTVLGGGHPPSFGDDWDGFVGSDFEILLQGDGPGNGLGDGRYWMVEVGYGSYD